MIQKIIISISAFVIILGAHTVFAGLSCSVSTTCNSPDVVVFRMASTSNSHSELPSQNNYPELVCCGGVNGLSNSCTSTFGVVIRLAGDTNAHAEENNQSTPPYNGHNACLSVPSGGAVTIGYQDNNCNGFDTTVASMATPPTNSHMGDASSYITKVCASATSVSAPPPPLCSNVSCGGGGGLTNNSNPTTPTLPPAQQQAILKIADFNNDGKVDILDLSILLYYIDHPPADISRYDLNKDGKLDFQDISILFYYWTVV